jgi:hypothetical protein
VLPPERPEEHERNAGREEVSRDGEGGPDIVGDEVADAEVALGELGLGEFIAAAVDGDDGEDEQGLVPSGGAPVGEDVRDGVAERAVGEEVPPLVEADEPGAGGDRFGRNEEDRIDEDERGEGEDGNIFEREHPRNLDLTLNVELQTRETTTGLSFHGRQIQIGDTIVLDLGPITVQAELTGISG